MSKIKNKEQIKDRIIAKIKITEYGCEGKRRYLAEIDDGFTELSFNASTLKKLLNRISKVVC